MEHAVAHSLEQVLQFHIGLLEELAPTLLLQRLEVRPRFHVDLCRQAQLWLQSRDDWQQVLHVREVRAVRTRFVVEEVQQTPDCLGFHQELTRF